jgi:predicted dinucleotide-binding enzyme
VTLGARDPEKGSVRHLAQELGVARARLADAAARAEVVLFAVPGAAMPDTISQAGAKIDGKIVIDAANNVSAAVAHSADLITAGGAIGALSPRVQHARVGAVRRTDHR